VNAQTDSLNEIDALGADTEYQYFVHVKALDTFANLIRPYGIVTNQAVLTPHLVFTSRRRLNMKEFKDKGLIRSYSIVRRNDKIIEQG